MLFDARLFAEKAHGDQMYGKHNYMYHVDSVVENIKDLLINPSDDLLCAAYLHDVVEDCDIPLKAIKIIFGDDIASIVKLVTDPKIGQNRKERKLLLYDQFKNTEDSYIKEYAAIVKLSDRVSNHGYSISSLNYSKMEMYAREYDYFINVFHYKKLPELDILRDVLDLSIIEMKVRIKRKA